MLAYDYPILGLFWTTLILFIFIAWIMLLFHVLVDIFRSHDMGGFAKALWAIFVIIVPWLGVLVYLIARGRSMTERDIKHSQDREAEFRSYVQSAAGSGTGSAEELAKLAELKAQGVLTEAEFAQQKAKLLG